MNTSEMMDFIIQHTARNGHLHIDYNEHHCNYETVQELLEREFAEAAEYPQTALYRKEDFLNEEDIKKCIENESLWCFQWYPKTPIGFIRIYASTFEIGLGMLYDIAKREANVHQY